MKRTWKTTLDFFVLSLVIVPIMIDTSPRDTTRTQISTWGGLGQYALIHRGCSGNILREKGIGFEEAGLKWSQNSPKREVGILAHIASDRKEVEEEHLDPYYGYSSVYRYPKRTLFALNPFVKLKARYIGVGAGLFVSSESLPKMEGEKRAPRFLPSFYFRLGNLRRFYWDAAFLQHPWLYSGNYLRIGIGWNHSSTFQPWFGIGFGPSDHPGLLYRGRFFLNERFRLQMLLRAGMSSSTLEPAIGVDITYIK